MRMLHGLSNKDRPKIDGSTKMVRRSDRGSTDNLEPTLDRSRIDGSNTMADGSVFRRCSSMMFVDMLDLDRVCKYILFIGIKYAV